MKAEYLPEQQRKWHFYLVKWGNMGRGCSKKNLEFSVGHLHFLIILNVYVYFGGGHKITADDYCSHEIKRCLLLGRKVMTNTVSLFKSRDVTLPTKVHPVKAMVFPVVMYGCESWTIKKAEC